MQLFHIDLKMSECVIKHIGARRKIAPHTVRIKGKWNKIK